MNLWGGGGQKINPQQKEKHQLDVKRVDIFKLTEKKIFQKAPAAFFFSFGGGGGDKDYPQISS